MISMFSVQNRINRIYHLPKENIYKYRFFKDLSSGYSFILGETNKSENFLTIEPINCKLSKLIQEKHSYDLNYDMEQVIARVT